MSEILTPDYAGALASLEKDICDESFSEAAKISFLRSWAHLKGLPWALTTDSKLRECLDKREISGWKF
jgi:hypothetical protein